MGLLDSDADELKKSAERASSATSSGRKVNQSGLGAFRGISKYSKLTDKYRAKSENIAAKPAIEQMPAPSVEQNGSTPFQPALPSPIEIAPLQPEVSAKLVQKIGQDETILGTTQKNSKSVQTPGNVSAIIAIPLLVSAEKSIEFSTPITATPSECEVGASKIIPDSSSITNDITGYPKIAALVTLGDLEVSAKSVHDLFDEAVILNSSPCKVSADLSKAIADFDRELASPELVSAMSVQSRRTNETSLLEMFRENDGLLIETEVGAMSVRPEEAKSRALATENSEPGFVGAKSVHSKGNVSAHSSANSVQSQSEVSSKVRAQVGAKLIQIQGNLEPLESVMTLSGAQSIVLQFLFDRCLWANSLVTPPITKQALLDGTKLPVETALSAVKRLRHKLIIDRHSYKDGKAGWTQYRLAEESYRELLQLNQYKQSQGKVGVELSAKVSASHSSSSSVLNINKNTTTNAPTSAELPEEWEAIRYNSLEQIRFGRSHLVALFKKGLLSAEQVQRSIDEFDHDLRVNKRNNFRTGPLNAFIGTLLKGGSYVAAGYEAPEDIEFRENLERMKTREREKAARTAEFLEVAFREWKTNQAPETLKTFSPFFQEGSPGFEAALKGHFQEKIWPSLKAK